jgi:hypothetical protein
VCDFFNFFFIVLAGSCSFFGLYYLQKIQAHCINIESELFALKHPLRKMHADVCSLKTTNKRIGNKHG